MEKSLATPEQSQSSVFMTPSSSVSKPLYQAPRPLILTPLPLSLLSPAATPKGRCMDLPPSPPENLDILSELFMRGFPHVSQQILAYLAPPDLCRWVDQLSKQPFFTKNFKPVWFFGLVSVLGLSMYAEHGSSKSHWMKISWKRSRPIVGSAKRVQKMLKRCTKQPQ